MARSSPPYLLRSPQPGDLGWIVARHGAVYAAEYGWGAQFEGIVAQVVADFVAGFDPSRERCWIAELDGQNVASVLLVKETETVARLRLLLVEPEARGMRLGVRLVEACVAFARESGYEAITLWTADVLVAARHIYRQTGFVLQSSEPNTSFDERVIDETWTLFFPPSAPVA